MSRSLDAIVLANAIRLISDKRRWTRFELARDREGSVCAPWHEEARAWCVMGALQKCAFDLTSSRSKAETLAYRILSKHKVHWRHVGRFNDVRGHLRTLELLNKMASRTTRRKRVNWAREVRLIAYQTPKREDRERERIRRVHADRLL